MRIKLHNVAANTVLGTALSLGLTLALTTGAGWAQDASTPPAQEGQGHWGHGPMTADQQLAHLSRALDLTADQQTQLKPVLEAQHQSMTQLRADQSLSEDDKHAKMEALNTDMHTKIEAVLTDAQKAKFEKMMQHRGGQGHWQHQGGEGGGQQQPE